MAKKRTTANGTSAATQATETISKAEAVRRALREGVENPTKAVEFIKTRFGINMTAQTFSSYKSQEKARMAKAAANGKKKPGRKPGVKAQVAAASTTSAAIPSPTPPAVTKGGDLVSHVAAIREAVRKLGADQVIRIAGLFE